jgi:hypothetical protein
MSREQQSTTLNTRFINCPKCGARLMLARNRNPQIDSAGFEVLSLECSCGARLTGIIDPYDDEFLLSD